jgi:hypothetical protein
MQAYYPWNMPRSAPNSAPNPIAAAGEAAALAYARQSAQPSTGFAPHYTQAYNDATNNADAAQPHLDMFAVCASAFNPGQAMLASMDPILMVAGTPRLCLPWQIWFRLRDVVRVAMHHHSRLRLS